MKSAGHFYLKKYEKYEKCEKSEILKKLSTS